VTDTKTDEPGSLLVAPRAPQPRDNWLEILETGVGFGAAGFMNAAGADIYSDVKGACRAAVKKFGAPPSGPGEGGGGGGDGEHEEYVHQLVAEAFIGPCPPGRKLVHLNGVKSQNWLENLAYVPESDPRPAAPLNPRPQGFFAKVVPAGKKRRKGHTR
jgi:hypothetical protein